MTIDIHAHLFWPESASKHYWGWMANLEVETDPTKTMEFVKEKILPTYWDPDGEILIKRMDKAGIDKTVLLAVDMYMDEFGEPPLTIEEYNKHISDVAKKYPDRLIYFCGLDPRRPKATELLEKFYHEFGARGLKLYPTCGWDLDDRVIYPFYERCAAWGIPILPHMGPENAPFQGERTHPSHLEQPLKDFPNLIFIAAHLGLEYWRDLIALGQKYKNVMADMSFWQLNAVNKHGLFSHILRRFLDEFGADRILFGTDGPAAESILPSDKWVKMIKNLPNNPPEEKQFTEEEVSAILDGNARRVLSIS